jgi:drug/metabolite transporter (DMT)-like permease
MKTILFTTLALLAFAGNSILCRFALGENSIDAASFTSIRLISGVGVLFFILKLVQPKGTPPSKGSWRASLVWFVYAIAFSYAYLWLDTGIGALILFASVQITMIVAGMYLGHKLHWVEWIGVVVSFFGFVYLVFPELTSPSLIGFILMALAGIAWGFYSLSGKNSTSPLSDTAYNFMRTLPLVLVLMAFTIQDINLTKQGIILAIISGGITSGIGYSLWYLALGGLTAIQAAVVQLLVPVLAGLGGILFADEILTSRLLMSAIIILSGILTVILSKSCYRK